MDLIGTVRRIWRAWSGFWFETQAPARLRLFRLCLGLLLFCFYAIRTPDLELFFHSTGILPTGFASDVLPMAFRYSLLDLIDGRAGIWVLHFIYLASLLALALTRYPRAAALVAYVLHVSFMHRNMSQAFGVDLISTFFLLYLALAGRRGILASMGHRLIQVQLCVIYAYSGLDKARGSQWWAGEALWGVVSNTQLARWDYSFVAQIPLVIVAATYATLAWEIYFPALVWVRRARPWLLIFGVALHIGIGVMINIPFFGGLMIVGYVVFLEEGQAAAFLRRLRIGS